MGRLLVLQLLLIAGAASAEPLRGLVTVSTGSPNSPPPLGYWRSENGRLAIAPARATRGTLVVAEPTAASTTTAAHSARVVIEGRALALYPPLAFGPPGTVFEIRNLDAVPRTIYLQDNDDLLPREPTLAGRSREVKLAIPGEYVVRDVEHPYARSVILVSAAPFVTTVDGEGRFSLEVPPGRYQVRAFDGAWSASQIVETGKAGEITLRLPPAHTRGAR